MPVNPSDPSLRSFIEARPDSDFPIQNLPFGVFSTQSSPQKRVGVAIGDFVLDLAELEQRRLLAPAGGETHVFDRASINAYMALGQKVWSQTRAKISELLRHDNPTLRDDKALRETVLVPRSGATMHLPIEVMGFTDFYSSREHASNVGKMFRPQGEPLMPNWLHMPIGYNGRASTVVVSGTPVRRPNGQMKPPQANAPTMGPSRRLDFELEMGVVVGQPNKMGSPISMAQAEEMIFGFVLLNDWSARDIQPWEQPPLGPFQAKAFATSISPWVVTREALAPFLVDGPVQEPAPLPYLSRQAPQNYDIGLEVALSSDKGETVISRTNFKYMYWSSAQQLAHHAFCGCAMRVGDLLGSGTISGPEKHERGSLLELSWNGTEPLTLQDGAQRTFLEDGDTLILRGAARGEGYRIGFGECAGTIRPAVALATGER
ncbi:MAG: fumarylacetoacetase [Methylobacteriaceae bacterium]|nr:fumarylacetoacetase [Methylobacteriaceae bacterium]